MNDTRVSTSRKLFALIATTLLMPAVGHATIVQFETNLGDFQVNLYDNDTPQTVANFLAYVQNGDYSESVVHRSVAGFIIQGGAVTTDDLGVLSEIPTRPAVQNEPVFANVRGTIAMAKLGGDPDSATSQWFFNLANNTGNLDNQNGGFTVFGEVIGNGMDVVDAIAAVPTFDNVAGLNDFPLQNYTAPNPIVKDNFVVITSITVVDTNANSADGLNPQPTTRTDNTNGGGQNLGGGGGGGGGNLGWLAICGLLGLSWRRYRLAKTA